MRQVHPITKTVFAVLLSGAMWFLSSGIYHIWILAWIAPVPLLIVLVNLRVIPALAAAFAASAIGALSWLVAYGPLSFAFVLMVAIPFTLVAGVWHAIATRAHPIIATLAFPTLIVSGEFLFSRVSPHGTLGSLSYSQGDVPPILQLASVTGLWGISFLVALLPAALATSWHRTEEFKLAATILAVGAAPIVLALVFGAVRLADHSPADQLDVGLASGDADSRRQFTEGDSATLAVLRAFADRAATLASRGAKLVVLPEKFVTVKPEYSEQARAILGATAREHDVMIVAGFYVVTPSERRNLAVVFGRDGDVILEYDKQHLVPGIEWGYRAGNAIGLLKESVVTTGVAICKDLDFVQLGREYAGEGVGLLLVPAWDFVHDRWLHSRMAVLRGVEGGYAIVRTATDGLLTVSDARGRIVAEQASSESTDVLLTATVHVSPGGTFYSRTGDWFAWLCIVASTAACAIAILVSYRHQRTRVAMVSS